MGQSLRVNMCIGVTVLGSVNANDSTPARWLLLARAPSSTLVWNQSIPPSLACPLSLVVRHTFHLTLPSPRGEWLWLPLRVIILWKSRSHQLSPPFLLEKSYDAKSLFAISVSLYHNPSLCRQRLPLPITAGVWKLNEEE